jgi:hypothetical protein
MSAIRIVASRPHEKWAHHKLRVAIGFAYCSDGLSG